MSITLQQAWAKTEPFQSVWTHSVVAGVVAQEVLEHVLSQGSREELARVLCRSEEALGVWWDTLRPSMIVAN